MKIGNFMKMPTLKFTENEALTDDTNSRKNKVK